MSPISHGLTLTGTLQRNVPAAAASGAYADEYQPVRQVRLRISQPAKNRAVVGGQDVADLAPVALFEPDEDVRHGDRVVVTEGTPTQLIGTTWNLFSPVVPSVPAYLSATAQRILTASG
jgi:hypothetical protein